MAHASCNSSAVIERFPEKAKLCPVCWKVIPAGETACTRCEVPLADALRRLYRKARAKRRWRRVIAALLSVPLPGAGHFYRREPLWGVGCLFFTLLGYMLSVFPGVIFHSVCVASAARAEDSWP